MVDREILSVEVNEKLDLMANLDAGSEEYKIAADSVSKLMDRLIELEKLDSSSGEKKTEDKKENIKFIIDKCLTAVGIVVPVVVAIWGTKTSLKFEETGTLTTSAGRAFVGSLFKFKK